MKRRISTKWAWGIVFLCMGFPRVASGESLLSRDSVPALKPENVDLSIRNPGRYSIRVQSASGASFALIDPITGPGETCGVAGNSDGRLDAFLDPGSFLLRIEGSGHQDDTVGISVESFKMADEGTEALPGLEARESTLEDLEMRDFWFSLPEARMIYIDAAGRALADMRIWLEGSWLTGDEPDRSIVESTPGHPLNRCRLMVHCPAGTHKVTVYGGSPVVWTSGHDEFPLIIRSGIDSIPSAGSISRTIGLFGEDVFFMEPGSNYLVMESLTVGTGMSIQEIISEEVPDLTDPVFHRIHNRNYPWVQRQFYDTESRRLVRVSGTSGTAYSLKWFAVSYGSSSSESLDGVHSVMFLSGGNPWDSPDLNAIIIAETRQQPQQEQIVASSTVKVGPEQSYLRRFNVFAPVSLFVEFGQDGDYLIQTRGTPARFVLEPFFLRRPPNYSTPLPQNFPSTVSVGSRIYRLTIQSDKPGAIDLAITPAGIQPDWNRIGVESAGTDGAIRFRDLTFSKQNLYYFIMNEIGEKRGYFIGDSVEPDQKLTSVFAPDPSTHRSDRNITAAWPLLTAGQQVGVLKEEGITGRSRLKVDREGIYDVTAKSIFPVSLVVRSPMRTDLSGYSPGGSGNTTVLRQYLSAGDYFVELESTEYGSGTVMLACQRLEGIHFGEIAPGEFCRSELSPYRYVSADLVVQEKDSYRLSAQTLGIPVMIRLQDADGWPMAIDQTDIPDIELDPGRYRIIQIASTGTRSSRLSVDRTGDPDPKKGEGPHDLDLARPARGLWEDREPGLPGDTWLFNLQAETTLTIGLSPGMEGRVIDPTSDETVGAVRDKSGWEGPMPPGEWGLVVAPVLPDHLRPYTITASADPLINGTSTRLMIPGKISLRIGGLEPCFTLISIDGNTDTRAILGDSEGRVICANDDVTGDWNPCLALWMLPGEYSLFVEPVSGAGSEIEVAIRIPPIQIADWPESGPLIVKPGTGLVRLQAEPTAADRMCVVTALSDGLSGLADLPESSLDNFRFNTFNPGRQHVLFFSPKTPGVCVLWNFDGRSDPVTIRKQEFPLTYFRQKGVDPVNPKWTLASEGDIDFAGAALKIEPPGTFRVTLPDSNGQFFLSVDGRAFSAVSSGTSTIAATEGFILGAAGELAGSMPDPIVERVVLSDVQPVVEWMAEPGSEMRVDVRLETGKKAVISIVSGFDMLEMGTDGNYSLQSGESANGSASCMYHPVIPDHRVRSFGIRVPVSGVSRSSLVTASMTVFNKDSASVSNAPAGSVMLPAKSILIVEGENIQGWAASSGIMIDRSKTENRRITFYNLGENQEGVAWSTSGKPETLPDRIPVRDGKGPRVFLGSGLNQIFTFRLSQPLQTGIAIESTGGQIHARLLDGMGVEIASGLVINVPLEAGDYSLMVQNPMDAGPAMIQPTFVLSSPDNLMRFGKEE